MVTYTDQVDGIAASQLVGFFEGWPEHPDQETHLRIIKQSSHVVLAKEGDRIIGFITAVSDNVLCAYVPLLEVLPDYRRQGVGKELVRLMLLKLGDLYMIDVTCDSELRPFYLSMGMSAMTAMCKRNYQNQSGKKE